MPDDKNKPLKQGKTEIQAEKKRFSKRISISKPYRVEMAMDVLRQAVSTAEQKDNPDRRPLLSIYKETIKDGHLRSQLRTAHNTIQQSAYYVAAESGKEDKTKTELLQKAWFTDFITHVIDSEFYGHSLIEFYTSSGDDNNSEFTNCQLVPRFHVQPQQGCIVVDYEKEIKVPYRNNLQKLSMLEIGAFDDLGLLEVAAREVIWKLYSRSDWSQYNEKFGMPLLSIETQSTDKKELGNIENMAQNFGANGYVIVNEGDKISFQTPSGNNGNSHTTFKDKAKDCNDEISKLINGQTMTADNGSSYAQSQVHERILNDYTIARMQRIQREINTKLIPFLINYGYPLQGCKFHYVDIDNLFKKPSTDNNKTSKSDNLSADFFV